MGWLAKIGLWESALAAGCGLLLGVRSQLFYLSAVQWQAPQWRLLAGGLAGAVAAWAIWALLAALLGKAPGLERRGAGRLAAWALTPTTAAAWLFWPQMDSHGTHWLLGLVLLAALLAGAVAGRVWGGHFSDRRRIIPWLLAPVLLGGLVLRLSGVNHGLPDIIAHCDTPKQLDLISQFLGGDLIPPSSYPLGHIYLYTAVLKALLFILPLDVAVPNLSSENIAQCAHIIVTVRVMQALLGAAIPWLVFLAARRLWDAWTGLLAAFLLACDPMHLTYSWQMMGEVPQTFWVMLSFLCAVRVYQGGGLGEYLLAGLAAGLAVATKMYGGYVVLAALAAHLLGARDRPWRLLAVLAALLAGAALGTPHLWLDPAGWWTNFWAESVEQYGARGSAGPQEGLAYLVRALPHRFSWAWLLGGLLGLVFLGLRHARADVVFLVPAACSLGLILVFRLGYLREWDLVNLTPYLSLALAAAVRQLWRWCQGRGLARAGLGLGLALLLGQQGLAAAGDSWVARQPDTRQYARQWLARHLPPGAGLLANLEFSAGYSRWADRVEGLEISPTRELAYLLGKDPGKARISAQALALERVWWQPPLTEKLLRPVQVYKLRNTYWEDPEIRLYLREVPDHRPQVLLPHVRVRPLQAAFWHTPWARRQVLDLLHEPGRREGLAHAPGPVGRLGYVALGQGRASLFFGPELGLPLEARAGRPLVGFCEPVRSPLPLDPRTYRLGLGQGRGVEALWVGLYQRPELMLPLLARFGQWPQMELALAQDAGHGQPAAEALLWLAAAQAAQGQEPAAQQTLERLDGGHPGFIAEYARLARQDRAGFLADLSRLATATPEMLFSEGLCWSRGGACPPAERLEQESQPQAVSRADSFHLWLPQAFLPGFLKLRLEVGQVSGQPGLARPARITVMAHYSGYFSRRLAASDLDAGAGPVLEVGLEVPTGPVRLEVILEAGQDGWPVVEGLRLTPDLAAEFRWRWGLLKERLPALAAREREG